MGGAGGGVIVHLKVSEGEYVIIVVVSVIGFDLHEVLQDDLERSYGNGIRVYVVEKMMFIGVVNCKL